MENKAETVIDDRALYRTEPLVRNSVIAAEVLRTEEVEQENNSFSIR